MPLKIVMKPDDQLFIGTTKVRVVSAGNTILIIEGALPVLRASDYYVLPSFPSQLESFVALLQEVYLTNDFAHKARPYQEGIAQVLRAMPDAQNGLRSIESFVAKGEYYKALRDARNLLQRIAGSGDVPEAPSVEGESVTQQDGDEQEPLPPVSVARVISS